MRLWERTGKRCVELCRVAETPPLAHSACSVPLHGTEKPMCGVGAGGGGMSDSESLCGFVILVTVSQLLRAFEKAVCKVPAKKGRESKGLELWVNAFVPLGAAVLFCLSSDPPWCCLITPGSLQMPLPSVSSSALPCLCLSTLVAISVWSGLLVPSGHLLGFLEERCEHSCEALEEGSEPDPLHIILTPVTFPGGRSS